MSGFKLDFANEKVIAGKGSVKKGLTSAEAVSSYVRWIKENPHKISGHIPGRLFAYIDSLTGKIETYLKRDNGCVCEIHFMEPDKETQRRMSWNKDIVTYIKTFLHEQEVLDERQEGEITEEARIWGSRIQCAIEKVLLGGAEENAEACVRGG